MEKDIETIEQQEKKNIDIKEQYEELVKKYEKLEQTHNTYKFDVEFNADISDIKANIEESDLNILKELKKNDNQEAYSMLIDKFKNISTYKDIEGNSIKYIPSDGQTNKVVGGDLFTTEINKIKGDR